MENATIHYERDGHVARLVIDQERRRNAVNLAMWRLIPDLLRQAAADPDVRLVVVTGAGSAAFSAGADISEFAELRATSSGVEAYEAAVTAALDAVLGCPKPTVAAVRGVCFGGGMEIALCCDLRFADANARFRMPGAQLGLGYAYSAVRLVADRLGAAATADILFTGREIGAAEAARLGIAQSVSAAETFDGDVAAVVARIAGNAPLTLLAAKRALIDLARPDHLRDRAAVDALVAACFASEDYAEGRAAFREKREPLFRAGAGTAPQQEPSDLSSAQKVTS
ncbi:enoyl-CoA hydratase [Aurantimonas sp. C2-6-R+9]|uniref:enoyl-CoA hydratase n=1 Tax=unclassified Aurantimonas TaxID=2638230 RepID=UPI002E182FCF|nr:MULTISPECIES: enoyl-CoA hydratase [unclassified Aurantimonas]MEC5291170.1 enoyl-CoA hydratase [Aurantimonas sp. C2-3-R2]MEC5381497.1 enoyl-CoA hydratase [Aurantimonas sp. C2-6-R+9]MEC5411868.1 enoyl-CoA hydratase [Aurantimonas sp. C2-4-R8]